MSDRIEDAVRALLQYEQADFDGIIVKASRQAIHEVVDALSARDAEIERLKAAGDAMETILEVIEALEEEDHILTDINAALTGWLDARDLPIKPSL
jgi:hypothetical protein